MVRRVSGSCRPRFFASIGSTVEWGKKFGLYSDPSETKEMAMSVENSGGVCFVPCFSGIQAPYNDPGCAASIVGLTYETRKEHITRAMLESFAFTCKQLYEVAVKEVNYPVEKLHVDGGVCNNSLVMQLTSDLLELPTLSTKDTRHSLCSERCLLLASAPASGGLGKR